jgi:nitrate reductase molybdenum cofactor assembly chaperone NarJ/NarW
MKIIGECYKALGEAFAYPWDKDILLAAAGQIRDCVERAGKKDPLASFVEFLESSNISRIQEEYVTTFDLSPACPPYLGHYLYGDNHKKGEYMIRVKSIYLEHDYRPPENELPDHISVVCSFLSHLCSKGANTERREFIAGHVMQAAEKMRETACERPDLHWRELITAAHATWAADSEEVLSC